MPEIDPVARAMPAGKISIPLKMKRKIPCLLLMYFAWTVAVKKRDGKEPW
jgi:hypothetical protein